MKIYSLKTSPSNTSVSFCLHIFAWKLTEILIENDLCSVLELFTCISLSLHEKREAPTTNKWKIFAFYGQMMFYGVFLMGISVQPANQISLMIRSECFYSKVISKILFAYVIFFLPHAEQSIKLCFPHVHLQTTEFYFRRPKPNQNHLKSLMSTVWCCYLFILSPLLHSSKITVWSRMRGCSSYWNALISSIIQFWCWVSLACAFALYVPSSVVLIRIHYDL